MNTPFYISGRERTNPPSRVSPDRYSFLALKDAEPSLGVPATFAAPASATWVLTTDSNGNRYFATTLNYDSVYTTFQNNSSSFVSTYLTVYGLSGNWESTYTTLKENSGTWLTVPSANSLYFKLTGGAIAGDVRIRGDLLVQGGLSALSGLEIIVTKSTATSSLSIINVGFGPALFVQQYGSYSVAEFYDAEGGPALFVGNITPPDPFDPDPYTGLIGIKTTRPNKTLSIIGDVSASNGYYTDGPYVSAGILLDKIIYDAVPPSLSSVYSTVNINSGNWESVYSSWYETSARYATYAGLSTRPVFLSAADIYGNVTIFGTLLALGSSFFTNTNISVTSALSVVNVGPGPALFVSQGKGPGHIASFFDADFGDTALYVGNVADAGGSQIPGVIGIKTSRPNRTLTVAGEISATSFINDTIIDSGGGSVYVGRNINSYPKQGIDNVFIGDTVAQNVAFASGNISIGKRAGADLTDGNYNVIVGQDSSRTITIGNSNVSIGYKALEFIQSGNFNVAVGRAAATFNQTGQFNVSLGYNTSQNTIIGNYNIHIGTGAGTRGGDFGRTVVIGNNAYATQDFQFVAGAPDFPFVNGRYYGDLSYYGVLSAEQTRTGFLTAWETRATNITASRVFSRHLIDGNILTLSSGLTAQGRSYVTYLSAIVSSGNASALQVNGPVLIFGPSTLTGGLSATGRLSAGFGFETTTGNYLSGTRGRVTTDLLNIFHDKNEGISVYSSTNLNSGYWQSSYTTMTATSARWEEAYFDTQLLATTLTANPFYGGKQILIAGGTAGDTPQWGSSWQFDRAYGIMSNINGVEYNGGYSTSTSLGGYIMTESGLKHIGYKGGSINYSGSDYNASGYNMSFTGVPLFPQMEKDDRIIKFLAGYCHCIFLTLSGCIYGKGNGSYGQLGHGTAGHLYAWQRTDLFFQPALSPGDRVIDISTSMGADARGQSFALTLSGFIYGCGENANGNLGQGNSTQYNYWTRVEGGACGATARMADESRRVVKLFQQAGGYLGRTFAIDRLGRTYGVGPDATGAAAGTNEGGQVGNGGTNTNTFVQLYINGNVSTPLYSDKIVTSGGSWNSDYGFTVALSAGRLYFTGVANRQYGYAGDNNLTQRLYFYQTTNYTNLSAIDAWVTGTYGNYGTLFVACGPNKALFFTGNNNNYIAGAGTGGTGPYQIPYACVRTDKYGNVYGQLTNVKKMEFLGVNAPKGAFALTSTGELYFSGYSDYGTNGLNSSQGNYNRWFTRINFDSDNTKIVDITTVTNTNTYGHVWALDNYGRVWGWGNNGVHQFGTVGWSGNVFAPHIIWPDA